MAFQTQKSILVTWFSFWNNEITSRTLPNSILYLTDTTVEAKEQSGWLSFDWDVYWMYKLLGRVLHVLDLEVTLIPLDSLVIFCYLHTSVLSKSALSQKKNEMMWAMVRWVILLLKRRLLQRVSSAVQAKKPHKDNSYDSLFSPLSAYF